MALQVLLSQKGPLPISAQFKSPGNMQMYLEVTGSVWSQSANRMIGIAIQIDGQAVGTAQIFSNGASTHRAVVPAYIAIQLGEGAHTLALTAAADTVSDGNDLFAAAIHY
jgi:hypothetical protein